MGVPAPTPLPVGTGLNLRAIWLNDADDLADVMAFEYAGDSYSIEATAQAERRQLATRARIFRSGMKVYEPLSFTLERVSPVQRLWLHDHVAHLMCFRDPIGTKLYGFYNVASMDIETLPTDEYGNADEDGDLYAKVKISFEEIDHSEATA